VRLCLGIHLARAEMRVMLDLVLRRLRGLRRVSDPGNRPAGEISHGVARLLVECDERRAETSA
jgi:cytochrome P450